MVNLELYKVFYTVAKCKSITKAAEELYISQPAVSHAIKQLESELGGKLFNRVSRGMELTETGGRQMFDVVEKAMNMLEEAERNFSNLKAVATGRIKIAASDNVINYFLLEGIKKFRQSYPDVSFKFINATSRGCAELVKSGKADVGFVNLPIDVGGVEFVGPTGKIHDVFVASSKIFDFSDTSISLSEISSYPLLFLDQTTMTRKKTEEFANSLGVKLDPTIELGSIELIVNMAVEGMGIACVPKEFVKKQLESGELKILNVTPAFPCREIGVICGKQKSRSFALQLFLDVISMDKLNFPKGALSVLEKLNNEGFDAYIVGGAVRDALLGRQSTDLDITTNAKTDEIKRVFAKAKIIETGMKHGTVTVVLDNVFYEITTFRSDGEYSGAHHPDSVGAVSDISGDLAHRDFTINAMAYSEKTGVIDNFGGKNDLENKVIRAVGDPEKRFNEDGLRILRAVRFASKLGFKIENNTLETMTNCINNLQSPSVERIFSEVTKILCGEYRYFALKEYSFFLFAVVPEVQPELYCNQMNRSHAYDVYEHTLQAIRVCKDVRPVIMWALLMHDSGKPFTMVYGTDNQRHFPGHWKVSEQFADKVLTRFKAPNEFRKEVKFLVLYHDDFLFGGKPTMRRFLNKYGEKFMNDLAVVKEADWLAHSQFGIEKYRKFFYESVNDLKSILENNDCYKISDLKINGEDVKALGYEGEDVGRILNKVLDAVIDEKLENDRQKILDYIKENG